MSKSPITCHVLDSSTGKPAQDVQIRLQKFSPATSPDGPDIFSPLATGKTNSDGRCLDLLPGDSVEAKDIEAGTYKIVFKTKEYFERTGNRKCFYPWVEITFELEQPQEHYHIPLLISPYSFTTYRGS
ncbi:hypothetical protein C8J56DRAFT_1011889 [Mycena floridula]|nr:hypothetical protein C8J56DRAFT_1011889 [Mycena floridula]